MSLVELAKSVPSNQKRKNNITSDEIELVLAWLVDDISLKQMTHALGRTDSAATVSWAAIRLREAYRQGILEIRH